MTNNEFKAWFEGFCEGVHGAPSRYQWDKVIEKVAKIDGAPWLPQIVYRDRPYPVWPYNQITCYNADYPLGGDTYNKAYTAAGAVDGTAVAKNTGVLRSGDDVMSQLREYGRIDAEGVPE